MTREQMQALALIIARGAGHALDVNLPGNDWEGIAEAALEYARTEGWSSPTATASMRRSAHEHLHCRVELAKTRDHLAALEFVLAAIVGAAKIDGVSSSQPNLDSAIEAAHALLANVA